MMCIHKMPNVEKGIAVGLASVSDVRVFSPVHCL